MNWNELIMDARTFHPSKGYRISHEMLGKIDALVKAAEWFTYPGAFHGSVIAKDKLIDALKAIGVPAREYSGDYAAKTD